MKVAKEILDGYSITLTDDEPSLKEWAVYGDDDSPIVIIMANYNTTSNYHHGFMTNDRRTGPVRSWDFDFQQWFNGLDKEDSDLMDSIERRFDQPHFKTIRSAFKWAVVVYEEYCLAKYRRDNDDLAEVIE